MNRRATLALVSAALVLAAGCAGAEQPGTRENPREVAVSALDSFTFDPSTIPVRVGETVRFVVTNDGELEHEFTIGSHEDLLAHAEVMTHGGMRADTATSIRLIPGQTKELIFTFTSMDDTEFGCLVPGHFPAGMAGSFAISP